LHRVLFQPSINYRRKVGFLAGETSTNAAVKIPTVVIDADALRWLAKQQNWFESISSPMVLTPHPGEMAALTGLKTEEIQKDRIACASSFAQKWHQVVVLKGALTVIAAPDGRINIIPIATSALAKAGSGDVLTGMITSLIGQGVQPFEAATLGAWMHAKAGLRAAEKMGCEASVLAREIIAALPEMVASVKTL
jgi:NAD(P)H-hydrate epimerase